MGCHSAHDGRHPRLKILDSPLYVLQDRDCVDDLPLICSTKVRAQEKVEYLKRSGQGTGLLTTSNVEKYHRKRDGREMGFDSLAEASASANHSEHGKTE